MNVRTRDVWRSSREFEANQQAIFESCGLKRIELHGFEERAASELNVAHSDQTDRWYLRATTCPFSRPFVPLSDARGHPGGTTR